MRVPGPPLRFLLVVVALWIGGRTVMLTWEDGRADVAAQVAGPAGERAASLPRAAQRDATVLAEAAVPILALPTPVRVSGLRPGSGADGPTGRPGGAARMLAAMPLDRPAALARMPASSGGGTNVHHEAVAETPTPAPQFPGEPAAATKAAAGRRWSGSAFLFGRNGGGAVPLAGGGQLGASQAGARIAYRIDAAGHIAAAARVYAPIDSPSGSEAAVGIDLHPLPGAPLRVSAERRIALGRNGRDAWSAYAAGGFFKGVGGSVEVDGYAQAGIVGVHARDLFADGALRAARRFDIGGGRALLAGAGAWAAAQPGAERVDVGPRVALRLPAGAAAISIAGEWRARVAGSARPRSGPALTIAADF